jgi:TolB-like protein/Flp pilus assembly protein TadD
MGNQDLRTVFSFGPFEAVPQTGELRKGGSKLAVPDKVFQLLVSLVSRSGELVSREELRNSLWAAGTYVDFDHNLNNTIARARTILSDPSEKPVYIETVGSRGYRFIHPVQKRNVGEDSSVAERITRLAVLPFEDLTTANRDNGYFSAGLTGEVITCLGHMFPRKLGVIARTTILRYANKNKSVAQIGRELSVTHLLEGTVQVANEKVHVTAQLNRVSDQTQVWAKTYDYRLTEVLTLQSEIAQRIVQALGLELLRDGEGAKERRPPANSAAYLEYLKGRYHQAKRTREGLLDSLRYFQRASELDSGFAPACAAHAISYGLLGWGGLGAGAPKLFFPKAVDLAVRALDLDDTWSESHTALALIKYQYEWDFRGAERLLDEAIRLNPSEAYAHQLQSYYWSTMGRPEEAIRASRRAASLDPLSISALLAVGLARYMARDFEAACGEFEKAVDLDSTNALAWSWLGVARSHANQLAEALDCFEKARASDAVNTRIAAWYGEMLARCGRTDGAQRIAAELHGLPHDRYVCPADLALLHIGLGEHDEALRWLTAAFEEHSPLLVLLINSDPRFDPLRSRGEFQELIGVMQRGA